MGTNDKRTINAVHTASAILNALQRLNGAGTTELANELDMAKSAVYSHLATLEEEEYIVKDGTTYRLGFRYLDMAEHVKEQFGKYDVVRSELDSLAEETGEVAQFAVEEHARVVYLYKAIGEYGVQTSSSVGSRDYLHCTALGNAMLAHLPEERIDEIIERRGLPKKTDKTLTDRESLMAELERTRERGYAIDDEENILGLRCIAAPIITDGEVTGAVSVSGPSSRVEGERGETELSNVVIRAANVIEINSKFST